MWERGHGGVRCGGVRVKRSEGEELGCEILRGEDKCEVA